MEVKPGETATVKIGGTGRPIVGKFAIPSSFPHDNWLAWKPLSLNLHRTNLKGPDMPLSIRLGSVEAKRKWYEQWAQTNEGKAFVAAQRKAMENIGTNFSFAVQPDGSFRIDDVPAGTYDLTAQFFPANIMNGGDWAHPLGMSLKQVVIPAMPGGRSDEPLDLGTIAVTPPQMQ